MVMIDESTEKVVLVDLPPSTKGLVTKKCDQGEDFFTIMLNANLSTEAQREAFLHEKSHIDNGDFYSGREADEIESERHTNN